MRWLKNLENLFIDQRVGACPFCGSMDTDYSYTVISPNTRMGYGDIWCNSCLQAFHLSRIKIDSDENISKDIPEDLLYLGM